MYFLLRHTCVCYLCIIYILFYISLCIVSCILLDFMNVPCGYNKNKTHVTKQLYINSIFDTLSGKEALLSTNSAYFLTDLLFSHCTVIRIRK